MPLVRKYDNYSTINKAWKHTLSIRQHFLFQAGGAFGCACHKAVLTVEAAVVLPFFVCFMVFVLYFFRILQVQADVAQALQYAGRRTAADYSIQAADKDHAEKTEGKDSGGDSGSKAAGMLGLVAARAYFQKQLNRQGCPVQFISSGAAGIHLLQSDFSGNYVELKAVYKMKLPVGLFGTVQYQIVQGAKCRKWTGYQPGQDTEDTDIWLYYTEHGSVYHASRSCPYLDLSIQGVPGAQVSHRRNSSGGKYYPCEKCASGPDGMVYITNYGSSYHNSLSCSGLKRSIYMIRKSEATDKRMCKKCGG